MAYVISDDCIACGACAEECPVSAISEGDGKYVIDADTCISCGACAGTCPVSAPHEASDTAIRQRSVSFPWEAVFLCLRFVTKIQQFLYIFPRGQDCAGRARNKLGG